MAGTGRDIAYENLNGRQYIRVRTLDDLEAFLENSGKQELTFKTYPISGNPEIFRYNRNGKVVTRLEDGSSFDNMEDFLCYVFQCDVEGYSNTEYIDVQIQ